MAYATELNRVIRRLAQSAGRRIARRHALHNLDALLRRIRRELRKKFPTIGKDGKEVVPSMLPEGQRSCPACRVYVGTAGHLADHVVVSHNARCWCGFRPKPRSGKVHPDRKLVDSFRSSLRGHFKRVPDLAAHAVFGAMGAALPK